MPRTPALLLALSLSSVLAGACESHEQEGNELALLIQRVQGYTDADEADQSAELAALERFRPSTKRVSAARDACFEAYSLVERAETDHAEARRMLEEVSAGTGDLAKTRPAIERRIASSNEAIEGAKPLIHRCTRLLSDLKRDHRR